jgi:two-component system chemotaxis sensor kinase CheA
MGEVNHEGTHLSAGIDLSQFYQVFFEEAGENLETMEQMLLNLDVDNADDEELNAIFRCAHSVKGGAATFGFLGRGRTDAPDGNAAGQAAPP